MRTSVMALTIAALLAGPSGLTGSPGLAGPLGLTGSLGLAGSDGSTGPGGLTRTGGLTRSGGSVATAPTPQDASQGGDELVLQADSIAELVRVAWFGADGRYHFSAYSDCNYSFLQSPSVTIADGTLAISAEYWRRTATAAGNRCIGGPGINTIVTMRARPQVRDGTLILRIERIEAAGAQAVVDLLLAATGTKPPMDYPVDLQGEINRVLHEAASFGIASLRIEEAVMEDDALRLRWSMTLGVW